ncbi:ATP-grasp domain-containing protein [Marinospirillum insulare]|uniref:Carbamoyl phosphate synthase-like protein n=1 Tax=Marinospirillum insulare TaxID=217169 RepID=A0ABQ5ZZB0_9GAMM|nr:ATP-grasp domain-containing protein [Marinospirillum insulare]GLR64423.1 carbamoyl phosphate synthase-like protein [Marinospirillum insulare]
MPDPNLLITSVAKKVSLVKAFVKEAAVAGIKVYGTDASKDAVALYFCNAFFLLPYRSDTKFLPQLIAACQQHQIGYLLPTSDSELLYFAEHRSTLAENKIQVLMSANSTLKTCISKLAFNKHCIQHQLPLPQNYTSLETANYPLVIKQEFSQATQGVHKLATLAEAQQLVKNFPNPNYLIQEFVEEQEYSIDAFFDAQGKLIQALARSRDQISEGESVISTSIDLPELVQLVEKLGQTLNFFGHLIVQAFYHQGQIKLVEVNPRFGGASALALAAGLNSPKWLVEHITGKPLHPVQPLSYGLKLLRYSTDYFLSPENKSN